MKEPFVDFLTSRLDSNSLLIACGLPASYKTETTEVIASMKGFRILRSDMIRLDVLRNEDIFDEKVASNMNKRMRVYEEMFRQAREAGEPGQGVILDATFVTQELRMRAAEIAAHRGMRFVIQQTRCPREVSLRRISRRTKENYESNALTEQAYENNVKKFEPVDLNVLSSRHPGLTIQHIIVDTTSDLSNEWFVTSEAFAGRDRGE